MTDANRANWYSDGEKADRRIDDLLLVPARPPAGDAVVPTLADGRDVLPIFSERKLLFPFASQLSSVVSGVSRQCSRGLPSPQEIKRISTINLLQSRGGCGLGDSGTGSLSVAERKKMFCRVSGWALILFGIRALVGLI